MKGRRSGSDGPTYNVHSQHGEIHNIGRDQHIYTVGASPTEDLRQAGVAVKLMFVVGVLLALAGFATIGFRIVSTMSGGTEVTDVFKTLPIGAGMFFGGIVILMISNLILTLRRRR